MIRTAKGFLLAGASVVAILAAAVDARADTITAIGSGTYTIPVTGEYLIELFGAQGGTGGDSGGVGGLGAEVIVVETLTAGTQLVVFVGGEGGSGAPGGG
ncbi:MAG: glycine-rich protein, partial [Roseiarcus sp.]